MDAHRIEILDRANDNNVIGKIAHHFELEFLPADHGLFYQHTIDRRGIEAVLHDFAEFLHVPCNAAAGTAHREARTNDRRKPDRVGGGVPATFDQLHCFLD